MTPLGFALLVLFAWIPAAAFVAVISRRHRRRGTDLADAILTGVGEAVVVTDDRGRRLDVPARAAPG